MDRHGTVPAQPRKIRFHWYFVPLAVLALPVVLVIVGNSISVSYTPQQLEYLAPGVCEDFVRDRLRSPSTADFQGDGKVVHTSDEYPWRVIGSVDAQNGFGATIRSDYLCIMAYDSATDHWSARDVTILAR